MWGSTLLLAGTLVHWCEIVAQSKFSGRANSAGALTATSKRANPDRH